MTRPWDPDGHADARDAGAEAAYAASERSKDRWRVFGIVLAVVTAVVGLAMVAALVLFVTAFNSYGSNK